MFTGTITTTSPTTHFTPPFFKPERKETPSAPAQAVEKEDEAVDAIAQKFLKALEDKNSDNLNALHKKLIDAVKKEAMPKDLLNQLAQAIEKAKLDFALTSIESTEGKTFKVPTLLLMAHSPVFQKYPNGVPINKICSSEALLALTFYLSTQKIPLGTIKPPAFFELLNFFCRYNMQPALDQCLTKAHHLFPGIQFILAPENGYQNRFSVHINNREPLREETKELIKKMGMIPCKIKEIIPAQRLGFNWKLIPEVCRPG